MWKKRDELRTVLYRFAHMPGKKNRLQWKPNSFVQEIEQEHRKILKSIIKDSMPIRPLSMGFTALKFWTSDGNNRVDWECFSM